MRFSALLAGLAAFSFHAAASLQSPAAAQEPLALQLKWVTQTQFAGYYVAKDKGFYAAEGLDVTIRPGGPEIDPTGAIASGKADVIVDWMPSALAAREKGVPLVNFAQIFRRSGLMLACRRDSGIKTPMDLKGRRIGVWFAGNEYPFLSWMAKLGFKTSGKDADVKVLKQGFNVKLLLRRRADCVSATTYNEYWMLIDGGLKPGDLIEYRYEDQGVATLEDGLYTTEAKLADRVMHARLARFLRATIRGWRHAVDHQVEATRIVLANDATRARTLRHQQRMMGEVAKLVAGAPNEMGYLDPAAYERTVDTLLAGKSTPVITRRPSGAWTHSVFEAAKAP